jgi:hypothetical protein
MLRPTFNESIVNSKIYRSQIERLYIARVRIFGNDLFSRFSGGRSRAKRPTKTMHCAFICATVALYLPFLQIMPTLAWHYSAVTTDCPSSGCIDSTVGENARRLPNSRNMPQCTEVGKKSTSKSFAAITPISPINHPLLLKYYEFVRRTRK